MKLSKVVSLGLSALVLASGIGFGGSSVATAAAFKPGDVTYEKNYGVQAKNKDSRNQKEYRKYSLKTRGVVAKDGKTVDMVVRITQLEKANSSYGVSVVKSNDDMVLFPKSVTFSSSDKVGAYKDIRFKVKTGTHYIDVVRSGYHAKSVKTTHKGTL